MVNKFRVEGSTVEMSVTNRQILFDLDDLPKVSRFNQWKVNRSNSIVADYRDKSIGGVVGKMHRVILHNLLTGFKFVKWLNGNPYDFRKANMKQAKASCHHVAGEMPRKGNEYRVKDGTVVLFIESKGVKHEALIDCEDYLIIREYTWNRNLVSGYVQSMTRNGREKTRHVYLHRILFGINDSSKQIDHINGDKLDNRRCNLRVCNQSQNLHNQSNHRKGTVGVSKTRYGWAVQMKIKNIYHRKQFKNFNDAVAQYHAWEQEFNPSGLNGKGAK